MNHVRCLIGLIMVLLLATTSHAVTTILDHGEFSHEEGAISPPKSTFDDWQVATAAAEKLLHSMTDDQAVTLAWTQFQLDAFVKHKMMPSRGARGLALLHVGMYDAVLQAEIHQTDTHTAVMMAAVEILRYLFPKEEHEFVRLAFAIAAIKEQSTPDDLSTATRKAMALGQHVAATVIAYAKQDGAQYGWNGLRLQWYGEGRYLGPGSWEPTPPYFYYPPEEPYAPTWKPWILKDAAQFLPPPPPRYGSKGFNAALHEVLSVSESLTEEQKQVAEFWVDGHGTVTPAGHWNQIAMDWVKEKAWTDRQVAQMFAHLNIAMADTFIAAWQSKYHYWTIRPVTAAKKILGKKFKPHILTPPFPSYVSGHAATSGSAAQIIAFYLPEHATEVNEMAEQAAHSRLLGGIHFKFDNDQGLQLGRQVSQWVISQYTQNDKNGISINNYDH